MPGRKIKPLILGAGVGSVTQLRAHRNPGLEIVWLERGTLLWQVEGRAERVPQGHVFFTLPWQRHGSVQEFEPGHFWHFCILRLDATARAGPRSWLLPKALGLRSAENRQIVQRLVEAPRHAWPGSPRLAWAIRELVRAHLAEVRPTHLSQRALICLVLDALTQVIAGGSRIGVTPAAHRRSQRVVEAIAADPRRAWTLTEMAVLADLGKSQFLADFRRETGESPRRFLNRKRIDLARLQLTQTDHSITRIAHDCAYASSQRFATVFRKMTGMSPSAYRSHYFKGEA